MKNFFKGISFSSICAGALAAVTSFLLSAKIGIAGSVIGVAAGSVVSAVATQVYKNVLKASGEKIQQAVPFPSSSETVSNERAADETQVLGSSEQDDETRIIGSSPVASDVTMVLSADTAAVAQSGLPRVISSGQEYADATRALGDIAGAGETSVFPNGQRGVSDVGVVTGKTGTLGSAHDARVQHAGQRSSNWLHSKYAPAIIAFVSALVGVGVSAGLILAFTGGQGTDTVVRDVVHEKVVPSHGNTDDYQTGGGQTPVQKPKSDSTDSNDETTTDGSDKPPTDPPTRPLPTAHRAIPMDPRPETAGRHPIIPAMVPARTERIRPTALAQTEARPAPLVMAHHPDPETAEPMVRLALARRDPPTVLPARREMQVVTNVAGGALPMSPA